MSDRVSVTRRDVVTIHVDIDMPEPLLAALRDAARSETTGGERVSTQVVVNVGGNKVGVVNPFARQWQRFTDEVSY